MSRIPAASDRPRRRRTACIPALYFFLVATAGPLTGQEIRGTVFAAADSAAIPDATVLLHRITSISGEVVDSTRSDASGKFRLAIVEEENPEVLYAAAAVRGGVSYFGPIMHPGADDTADYAIYVHEVESVDAPVTENPVLLRHVVVNPTAHGLFQVAELVDVAGTPGRAQRTTDPSIPIWSMVLPRGFQSWAPIEGGIPPEAISEAGGRVEARATLPPNGLRLAYGYFTEGPNLEFPVEYLTERFEIILVGAEAEELRGLSPGDAAGLPPGPGVERLVASDVQPGSTVGLTIATEPFAWGPVLISVLIGVALLVAAVVSARLARRSTT